MPRPRRKPFWRWTPLPWLVLVALMLVAGSMHDLRRDGLYLAFTILTVVFVVAFAIALFAASRRRGPNFTAEGRLLRLDGLELVEVPAAGHPLTVYGVERHQTSIEAARAHTSGELRALLISDAGSWWGLRSDIAVYLLSGVGFHLIGRLGDQAQVSWQHLFDEWRAAGRFLVVPAEVAGTTRHLTVDVRLEGAIA
ncbi:hypothetical protein ACFOYW_06900 [Gryllotalpicola reticulitermitis]|uniref:DUF3093 domain-containing protein n=1 Tax=Gryllotalpicola reticulitermitis TaxID=1184153 RepID=A0ABV8Q6J2_9MICO